MRESSAQPHCEGADDALAQAAARLRSGWAEHATADEPADAQGHGRGTLELPAVDARCRHRATPPAGA